MAAPFMSDSDEGFQDSCVTDIIEQPIAWIPTALVYAIICDLGRTLPGTRSGQTS